MEIIYQEEFRSASQSGRNDRLVIHRRAGGANRALIIFVHGFGGSRYTTWGKFPQFLFADFPSGRHPELDLGFYEYRTAFRRLQFTRSIPVKQEAQVLADIVRDLKDYRKVIFIVHSMGGILAKAAIANLIGRNDPNARAALAKVVGLIMFGTPQAGSSWVPTWLAWLTNDTRVLVNHNDLLTDIDKVFGDHVASRVTDFRPDRLLIPIWGVLGAEDFWVGTFSGRLGMTSGQQKLVEGSHTEIVKPKHGQGDGYVWVRDRINECLSIDQSVLSQKQSRDPIGECLYTIEEHVSKIYEELWQAYRPVLQASGTVPLEADTVHALMEPINAFALSGPHRRRVLEALQQLRVLLQRNGSVQQLANSVDRFLGRLRDHEESDSCFMRSLTEELGSQGRVNDGTRAHIENWMKSVKRLCEDVVTAVGGVRGSQYQNLPFDKDKATRFAGRVERLIRNGQDLLSRESFMRGRGDGRSELVGWLTEAQQITEALPGGSNSYRTQLSKTLGLELDEGDVYKKAQSVYQIMRRLLESDELG
ncbi:MAG: alpha/beta hydrolase [Silvibacterium sp.]|jgi:pimeloyl-ACP methyl ester carboxylesterase